MNIRIDRPSLNRKDAKENIAMVDRWIADTADKLNNFSSHINTMAAGLEADILVSDTNIASLFNEIKRLSDRVKALEEGVNNE